MDTFWICYVENSDGGYHRRQTSLEEAKAEAKRLARIPGNDGRRVFVMQCIGCATYESVKWEDANNQTGNESLPF